MYDVECADVVLSTYYVLRVIDCTAFVIMHPEPDNWR
jgi:hypothetical protein